MSGALCGRRTGARPGTLPAVDDDPVRRLVVAWLLGYASPSTRRAYAGDITAWLAFCDQAGTGPLQARSG
jgi:hypothetical protein